VSNTIIPSVAMDTSSFMYIQTPYGSMEFSEKEGHAADVCRDQNIVGTMADGNPGLYEKTAVPQEDTWPTAKFIATYQEKLFVANFDKDPYRVQWSAPIPFQTVWPSICYSSLGDLDSSPITGMKAFGEHLAVFKNDSIWRAVPLGVDSNGLSTYQFVKVPGTVGTMAPRSIVDINNMLYFLGEDGVYVYDGISQPKRISDALHDFFTKLPKKLMTKAAAIHWKAMHCYLISLTSHEETATDKQTNNTTLVYDYVGNSWWIWNGMNAQYWCKTEGADDEEIIYFIDEDAHVNQIHLNQSSDDGVQIDSWFMCHRMVPANFDTMCLREVQVYGEMEEISDMYVDVYADDDYANLSSGNIDFNNENINKVGSSTLAASTTLVKMAPRCIKKLMFRKTGKFINVGVGTDGNSVNTGKPWAVSKISCGFVQWGKR
jgi:hypothetical protein